MSSATPFKKIVRRSNDIGIDRYQAMFQHANPVDVPSTVAVLRQATTQRSMVENQSVVLGCEHLRGGCAVGETCSFPVCTENGRDERGDSRGGDQGLQADKCVLVEAVAGRAPGLNRPDNPNI